MNTKNLDKRFLVATIAAFIFAILFFYVLIFSNAQKVADPEVIKSRISHMGEVLDYEVIPSTGLTAWKIKPEGLDRHFIFYTTANGKALLTGSIWDAETGTEISSGIKLVQDSMVYNQEAGAKNPDDTSGSPIDTASAADQSGRDTSISSIDGNGEVLGPYTEQPPIIFDLLDKMKGFKTNAAASATDTVYIFYDPRCPVCKKAFDKIDMIDLEAKNIAVKWLPTTALGPLDNLEDGIQRAAYAFQAKDYSEFTASMKGNAKTATVSNDEREYLVDNLDTLKVLAAENYGPDYKPEVPAAIYMNKEAGVPKMLFGITNDRALKTIFGE